MRGLLALAVCFVLLGLQGRAPAQSPSPFADWAAVVAAGDTRSSTGGQTQAFENARRDIAKVLVDSGFSPANVRTLGLGPRETPASQASAANLARALGEATGRAPGGCLLYLTSHGTPAGMVFGGDNILAPRPFEALLRRTCGERPTVVFVSACYSGVFIPALAAPNRLVLTAARPDRTSFGCGEGDRYPFFDACVLQSWPQSSDFLALGRAVRLCVARREQELRLQPPSEPQLFAGPAIRPLLPLLTLSSAPAPGAPRPAPAAVGR